MTMQKVSDHIIVDCPFTDRRTGSINIRSSNDDCTVIVMSDVRYQQVELILSQDALKKVIEVLQTHITR